jgi:formylglycine-generating enzyme required for sulfatase activity
MNALPKLQVGGTLNPRKHIYIERGEDNQVYHLLRDGDYVNILSSRQMGKSSLVMRLLRRLQEVEGEHQAARTAYIDLAAKLGKIKNQDSYYQALLTILCECLDLKQDVQAFWKEGSVESPNQKLMRFFRQVIGSEIDSPLVIFLDEIDSSLSLPFTDDLFTAIRGIYNERSLVEAYDRITFCLIGVATPNELIKDRRTTPYNVGTTVELRDFDARLDDLSLLIRAISTEPVTGKAMLERVLYWTGGQPYLTAKLCMELVQAGADSETAVDAYVEHTFSTLERMSSDVHFQQILRFLDTRLSDALATFDLYTRLLEGKPERDQTTAACLELKLSGLVRRDGSGYLVSHNRIYQRLFDKQWAAGKRRRSELAAPAVARTRRTGRIALAASVMLAVVVTWWLSDDHHRAQLRFALGLYPLLEPEMRTIPAGQFEMGDLNGGGNDDEKPVHTVRFTKAFQLGIHEVTFDQYDQFALVTGRELPDDEGWGRGTRPVINVSWVDAVAYAEWLSEETGKRYRLPSEAEWEYAARAGTPSMRYWGDDRETACTYANVLDSGNKAQIQKYFYSIIGSDSSLKAQIDGFEYFNCTDEFPYTAPVGEFTSNAWGLHDMLGNVWQWVWDCYVDSYEGAPTDGTPREVSGTCEYRVLRGGSWNTYPQFVRSAFRSGSGFAPANRSNDIGFRLARTN